MVDQSEICGDPLLYSNVSHLVSPLGPTPHMFYIMRIYCTSSNKNYPSL